MFLKCLICSVLFKCFLLIKKKYVLTFTGFLKFLIFFSKFWKLIFSFFNFQTLENFRKSCRFDILKIILLLLESTFSIFAFILLFFYRIFGAFYNILNLIKWYCRRIDRIAKDDTLTEDIRFRKSMVKKNKAKIICEPSKT